MVNNFLLDKKDVVEKIRNIDEQTQELLNSETIDENKLFKLRYQQLMQGLYLQN